MKQGGLAGSIVAVCATAATLAPSLALAGTPGPTESLGKAKGIEYMRAKYLQVVTQTAQPVSCDGDAEVTGGGGSMAGPATTSALNETYPVPESGWQAEGTSTGDAKTLTGYAVCGPVDVDYETSQVPLSENAVSHGSAICPDPIGGGGGATGPGMRLIGSSPRLPPSTAGWAPSMWTDTMDDTLFNMHAVCGPYDVKFREADTKLDAGGAGQALAKCRSDEVVLGGGFVGRKQDVVGFRTLALASKPWDSDDRKKVPDDGWRVRALNAETLSVKLRAIATCRQ